MVNMLMLERNHLKVSHLMRFPDLVSCPGYVSITMAQIRVTYRLVDKIFHGQVVACMPSTVLKTLKPAADGLKSRLIPSLGRQLTFRLARC